MVCLFFPLCFPPPPTPLFSYDMFDARPIFFGCSVFWMLNEGCLLQFATSCRIFPLPFLRPNLTVRRLKELGRLGLPFGSFSLGEGRKTPALSFWLPANHWPDPHRSSDLPLPL